jgi:hypothetical protein
MQMYGASGPVPRFLSASPRPRGADLSGVGLVDAVVQANDRILARMERKHLEHRHGRRPLGVRDGDLDGYRVTLLDHLSEGEAAAVLVVRLEQVHDRGPVRAVACLALRYPDPVGFANSCGLVLVDESAEQVAVA